MLCRQQPVPRSLQRSWQTLYSLSPPPTHRHTHSHRYKQNLFAYFVREVAETPNFEAARRLHALHFQPDVGSNSFGELSAAEERRPHVQLPRFCRGRNTRSHCRLRVVVELEKSASAGDCSCTYRTLRNHISYHMHALLSHTSAATPPLSTLFPFAFLIAHAQTSKNLRWRRAGDAW